MMLCGSTCPGRPTAMTRVCLLGLATKWARHVPNGTWGKLCAGVTPVLVALILGQPLVHLLLYLRLMHYFVHNLYETVDVVVNLRQLEPDFVVIVAAIDKARQR